MPSSLKNDGAMYEKFVSIVYDHYINKKVEMYIDDMAVKNYSSHKSFNRLASYLDRLTKYKIWLKPMKCTFGCPIRKFF